MVKEHKFPDTFHTCVDVFHACVDVVVIGRNEGQRLIDSLASLQTAQVRRLIYVDSGSSDGSIEAARAVGAEVVELDMTRQFTAARARNAGLKLIRDGKTLPDFVHFVDGDCQMQPDWMLTACDYLVRHPDVVVVSGRLRERFPEATIYNRLFDLEWDTPIGEARTCAGNAMMRTGPLLASGGYRESLIAGEEPELCLRLRRAGGKIWRIDYEMGLHDAAMTRFSQWWRRSRRAGYAYAEGAALHGRGPERHWRHEVRRAIIWGLLLPLAILVALFISWPLALLLALIYPAQLLRLAARRGLSQWQSWQVAFFTLLGKFPEMRGALSYWRNRLCGEKGGLIEYK